MTTDRKQWIAGAFAVLVLGTGLVYVLLRPAPAPITADPLPDPVGQFGEARYFGGWQSDPEAVEAVAATLPVKRFADSPAFKMFRGKDTTNVLLSDACKKVTGAHLPARDQGNVGCCVGFGSTSAVEYLICVEIVQALNAGQPPPSEFRPLVQEAAYGGSRVEIGQGKLGRGDGSVTAWAGKWYQQYGALARDKYGSLDLTSYSESRARQWGKNGVPDNLEHIARQSPVKSITLAKSADEVAKAIRQGYTVAVGSGVGFGNSGPWHRDKDGFLKASGQWGHCMAVVGVRGDARKGFLFLNSWGNDWISGPTGGFDMPPGSFWVDWKTADKMFAEGDCVIFGDAAGFPAKAPLDDFWINVPVPRRDVVAGSPSPRKDDVRCFALAF